MSKDEQMPCGRCDAGIYAAQAILNGVEMFKGCAAKKEALRLAPRCKSNLKRICYGAKDFIAAVEFPIDAERITREVERA